MLSNTGHSFVGNFRNCGPVNHGFFNLKLGVRTHFVARSAVFSFDGIYRQLDISVVSCISDTRNMTNCLYRLESDLSQRRTVFESVQYHAESIRISWLFTIFLASREPRIAARSSIRGIETGRNGATFVFEDTKEIYMPPGDSIRK